MYTTCDHRRVQERRACVAGSADIRSLIKSSIKNENSVYCYMGCGASRQTLLARVQIRYGTFGSLNCRNAATEPDSFMTTGR